MSRRIVTREDVVGAKSGTLEVGPEDVVTAAALEAAAREGVRIVRAGEGAAASRAPSPSPAAAPAPTAAGPWDAFSPGTAATTKGEGTPTAIVTAVGRNRPFVLAEISTKIGELNGDVLDISQRIVSGYFSTILVVDLARIATDFAGFKQAVESLSKDGDYKIVVQHERIFRAMHRI